MTKSKNKYIDANNYILKALKPFNFYNSPNFIIRLGCIFKIFRNILLFLLGIVEIPVLSEKHI